MLTYICGVLAVLAVVQAEYLAVVVVQVRM